MCRNCSYRFLPKVLVNHVPVTSRELHMGRDPKKDWNRLLPYAAELEAEGAAM